MLCAAQEMLRCKMYCNRGVLSSGKKAAGARFLWDSGVYFFGIFTNHTCISNDSGINYAVGSAFRISGKQ